MEECLGAAFDVVTVDDGEKAAALEGGGGFNVAYRGVDPVERSRGEYELERLRWQHPILEAGDLERNIGV